MRQKVKSDYIVVKLWLTKTKNHEPALRLEFFFVTLRGNWVTRFEEVLYPKV